MRAGRLSILLAAAVLAGCTHAVDGTAAARFTLPVANFPDTRGFTEVDAASFYIRDGNPEYGFGFRAPNGLRCGMGSFPIWRAARAFCTGRRRDKGPGVWTVTAERFGETTITRESRRDPNRTPRGHHAKVLPPRHFVVDSGDTLCLVTQDSIVACHVGEHGFILAPKTTTLF
ncbi:hypothetical protein PT015_12860 [Candidatus Mycobacterium wuenschmannii]|uniref:Lipoprotein n=1 Tax=Candidatus Mycobacterium wuenschmannii TaxID=3027808 RepID=A0ABY8VS61_9MYCO|nr:hypothetical protein [Candidatus Mycobacterium wuenschmannii]WIM85840.1 hypothetical protein PT015_12860 [Candidatus Mycobacterium wuenschmannii]